MRLLYTVQRYGTDIVGGSEAACRMFAEHLVGAGHDVEVVTSCARRYLDWANEYPAGTAEANGVVVHRLAVTRPRTDDTFGPLNQWTIAGPRPMLTFQQTRWSQRMGPELEGYRGWLMANAARFDAAIHMTYLYATTTFGLPVTAGLIPTIMQPTAHNEPAIWVRRFDTLFRLPDSFLYFTPEEQSLVGARFGGELDGSVVGIGIDLVEADDADVADLRLTHGLGDDPYLLYLGRIDPMKGAVEAIQHFIAYKARYPGRLKLVLVGDAVVDVPAHPDIRSIGFLDERRKRSVLRGAIALLQPSYFESFSIVLCESWVQRRPALVQSASPVLSGQAQRSCGAIPYHGFAEFEASVNRMLTNRSLASGLGANGRRYVEDHYSWPSVVAAVEAEIGTAIKRFATRRALRASRSTPQGRSHQAH